MLANNDSPASELSTTSTPWPLVQSRTCWLKSSESTTEHVPHAVRAQEVLLVAGPRRGEDLGPGRLSQLNGRQTHPAGRCVDQDALAALHSCQVVQAVVGRDQRRGYGRGVFEGQVWEAASKNRWSVITWEPKVPAAEPRTSSPTA